MSDYTCLGKFRFKLDSNMKKLYLIAIVFALLPLVFACKKNDSENDENKVNSVTFPDKPTEDQFLETCKAEAKIYGNVEQTDPMANALTGRMENVTSLFNEESTKVVFVTDEDICNNVPTVDNYIEMYKCYKNEGAIVISNPTKDGTVVKLMVELGLAAYLDIVTENEIQIDGVTEDSEDFIARFTERTKPIEDVIGDNGDLLAIAVTENGYYCIRKHIESGAENVAEMTPYDYGCLADNMVKWIDEKSSQSEKTVSATKGASGNIDITKSVKPYEIVVAYPDDIYVNDYAYYNFEGVFEEIIYVYLTHDIEQSTDYYLVTQHGTFHNSVYEPVPNYDDHSYWWRLKGENWYYIKYFKRWQTSLGLEMGDSEVSIVEAQPQANNGATTTSEATATCTSSSTTQGFVVGASGGTGALISASYTHSYTTGESTTYTVGKSRPVSDIEVIRTMPSDPEYNISWTYTGNDAYSVSKNKCSNWVVGNLLISDMTLTNSALFKVVNASSGRAKFKEKPVFTFQHSWLKGSSNSLDLSHVPYKSEELDYERVLPFPIRSAQEWTFNVEEYGNAVTLSDKQAIANYILTNLLNKSAVFLVPDVSDKSVDTAMGVMNVFIERFETWNAYNVKGKFKFSLTRMSDKKKITASSTKY